MVFKGRRSLRQGEPLSLLIFVLVVVKLHHMIIKSQGVGFIEGLGCRDDTNTVISLHYEDDTIVSGKGCLAQVMVLKWVLFCYEKWSGIKINYHKSSLIFLGISLLITTFSL